MVQRETVAAAHDEIISLLEDTQKSGAAISPAFIRVVLILEKLTNLNPAEPDSPALETAREQAKEPIVHVPLPSAGLNNLEDKALQHFSPTHTAPAQQPSPAEPGAKCPPHLNINQFGVCRDCGTCTHQSVDNAGNCRECGAAVKPAEAEAPAENASL